MRQYLHTDLVSPRPMGPAGDILSCPNLPRQDEVFADVVEARIIEGGRTFGRFRARSTVVGLEPGRWKLTVRVFVTGRGTTTETRVVEYESGPALAARVVLAAMRGMTETLPGDRYLQRVL